MQKEDTFLQDIWRGLNTSPKYLESKYFYDEAGDKIFAEIMACPEYYLTNCELEICQQHSPDLVDTILGNFSEIDVVELGAGDATKSIHILRALMDRNVDFTYYPIDISNNIITQLTEKLPAALPGLKVHGLNGDYFDMLDVLKENSKRHKVVLFLGSSIGNIPFDFTNDFLCALRSHLLPGDLLLTGFDLKKDPKVILAAYNDKEGITKRFNFNLLKRINNTLNANFDLSQFEHRPEYDPETGACKSYLYSLKDQQVQIGDKGIVTFKEGESIFMEISQKYTVAQTDDAALATGFTPVHHYYDSKEWFLDALWQVNDPNETPLKQAAGHIPIASELKENKALDSMTEEVA